jgi:hypothetical protein
MDDRAGRKTEQTRTEGRENVKKENPMRIFAPLRSSDRSQPRARCAATSLKKRRNAAIRSDTGGCE